MLRVTYELGKEAGNVCLRRNRCAPQALSGGSDRPGRAGPGEPERAQRGGADFEGDRWLAAGHPGGVRGLLRHSWLVELLENYGFDPHLVHPSRCKAIASARLKNDKGRRRDRGPAAAGGPAARSVDRPAAAAAP